MTIRVSLGFVSTRIGPLGLICRLISEVSIMVTFGWFSRQFSALLAARSPLRRFFSSFIDFVRRQVHKSDFLRDYHWPLGNTYGRPEKTAKIAQLDRSKTRPLVIISNSIFFHDFFFNNFLIFPATKKTSEVLENGLEVQRNNHFVIKCCFEERLLKNPAWNFW